MGWPLSPVGQASACTPVWAVFSITRHWPPLHPVGWRPAPTDNSGVPGGPWPTPNWPLVASRQCLRPVCEPGVTHIMRTWWPLVRSPFTLATTRLMPLERCNQAAPGAENTSTFQWLSSPSPRPCAQGPLPLEGDVNPSWTQGSEKHTDFP